LCDVSYWDDVDPINQSPPFYEREFFANTNDITTTPYAELVPPAGDTNCDDPMDTAAYWIPRVSWTDSRGNTTKLTASITRFYYRLGEKSPTLLWSPTRPWTPTATGNSMTG
jgi:hypothetical protein